MSGYLKLLISALVLDSVLALFTWIYLHNAEYLAYIVVMTCGVCAGTAAVNWLSRHRLSEGFPPRLWARFLAAITAGSCAGSAMFLLMLVSKQPGSAPAFHKGFLVAIGHAVVYTFSFFVGMASRWRLGESPDLNTATARLYMALKSSNALRPYGISRLIIRVGLCVTCGPLALMFITDTIKFPDDFIQMVAYVDGPLALILLIAHLMFDPAKQSHPKYRRPWKI